MPETNPYESPAGIEDARHAFVRARANEFHDRLVVLAQTCVEKTAPVRAYLDERGERISPFLEALMMSGATGMTTAWASGYPEAGLAASAVTASAYYGIKNVFSNVLYPKG